jgi:hypothetical protein
MADLVDICKLVKRIRELKAKEVIEASAASSIFEWSIQLLSP